jgi:uncharacterized membrane protein
MTDTTPERVLFAATLTPHRSLPPRGFAWLMGGLAALGFCTGIGFVAAGAWPVMPFFGVDVALLYLAFRCNYRRGRAMETIQLTERRLDVERVSHRGERERWRFQPFWVRVILEERDDGRGRRLLLASHGNSLALGAFLSVPERQDLADSLKAALRRWRDGLRD